MRRFQQIDVFTKHPFRGNPLAVILDGQDLDTQTMQQIAAWTNLSETTFVQPPTQEGADYRLRIFTPRAELPFAGHPTVGSAYAILQNKLIDPTRTELVQECGAGLLSLRVEPTSAGPKVYVRAPMPSFVEVSEAQQQQLNACLGGGQPVGDAVTVDVGPRWLVTRLKDAAAVHQVAPEMAAIEALSGALDITGVIVCGTTGNEDVPLYTRAFAPRHGVPEDPVCGSGNASAGAALSYWGALREVGRVYTANQGHEVGRDGYVEVRVSSDHQPEIGGHAVICIAGGINIP